MNPLERSAAIRKEADVIIETINLYGILSPCKRIQMIGSYFLDTMIYPDIDLYVSKVSIKQLFEFGERFAQHPLVYEVVFQKSQEPDLPGDLYLKPRIKYGNWGHPWKIDIWSLDEKIIDEKMEEMYHFKEKMTEDIRKKIIRYKYSILTKQHRMTMLADTSFAKP